MKNLHIFYESNNITVSVVNRRTEIIQSKITKNQNISENNQPEKRKEKKKHEQFYIYFFYNKITS